MLYNVETGRHKSTVDSEDKKAAAVKFLAALLQNDESPGHVVGVTIPGGNQSDAMFFDTGGLIEEHLENGPPPKQYTMTLVA